MEKYEYLSKITNEYLSGKLTKLVVSYDDPESMFLSVVYKIGDYHTFDYELNVDMHNKEVSFIDHQTESPLNKVSLQRKYDFETAVKSYFFPNK